MENDSLVTFKKNVGYREFGTCFLLTQPTDPCFCLVLVFGVWGEVSLGSPGVYSVYQRGCNFTGIILFHTTNATCLCHQAPLAIKRLRGNRPNVAQRWCTWLTCKAWVQSQKWRRKEVNPWRLVLWNGLELSMKVKKWRLLTCCLGWIAGN